MTENQILVLALSSIGCLVISWILGSIGISLKPKDGFRSLYAGGAKIYLLAGIFFLIIYIIKGC